MAIDWLRRKPRSESALFTAAAFWQCGRSLRRAVKARRFQVAFLTAVGLHAPDELYGVLPVDRTRPYDTCELLARQYGRLEEALPYFEKARRLDPRLPPRSSADVLAALGRLTEAREVASMAWSMAPTFQGRSKVPPPKMSWPFQANECQ